MVPLSGGRVVAVSWLSRLHSEGRGGQAWQDLLLPPLWAGQEVEVGGLVHFGSGGSIHQPFLRQLRSRDLVCPSWVVWVSVGGTLGPG